MARIYHTWHGYYPGAAYVTDGLVLFLDADGTTSYPGSGSTWFDLSGLGNDATIVNSPIYSALAGGYLELNPLIAKQYIDVGATWVNTGAYSIEICFTTLKNGSHTYLLDSGSPRTLIGSRVAPNTSDLQFYSGGSWRAIGPYPAGGAPHRIALTVDAGDVTGYVDGVSVGAISSAPYNDISSNVKFFGGQFTAGASEKLRLHQILIYKKELSAAEVAQNADAFRSRFGYA